MSQLEKWVTQKICQLKNGVTLKNVSVFKRWVTFKKSVIQLKKLVTSKEMLYSWKNGSPKTLVILGKSEAREKMGRI